MFNFKIEIRQIFVTFTFKQMELCDGLGKYGLLDVFFAQKFLTIPFRFCTKLQVSF